MAFVFRVSRTAKRILDHLHGLRGRETKPFLRSPGTYPPVTDRARLIMCEPHFIIVG